MEGGVGLPTLYGDVLGVWREWADDVRGHMLDSGHHVAEEVPTELAGAAAHIPAGVVRSSVVTADVKRSA